jgi:homoserine O-acetyltransferase
VEHQIFDLGDFALQKGGSVIPDAKLGYVTLGELSQARDNVVVCPTWFTATPSDTAMWMTGAGRALDPDRWFIVVPNHFGAAVSSSPSNTPAPFDRGRFPRTTVYDSVIAQQRLLTEGLGVERIRLVSSWSMGAAQSYAWGALFGDMVDAIAPISGSARTAHYNKVFLAGNIRAITSDPDWKGGFYTDDAPPIRGVRAMAAIYAG